MKCYQKKRFVRTKIPGTCGKHLRTRVVKHEGHLEAVAAYSHATQQCCNAAVLPGSCCCSCSPPSGAGAESISHEGMPLAELVLSDPGPVREPFRYCLAHPTPAHATRYDKQLSKHNSCNVSRPDTYPTVEWRRRLDLVSVTHILRPRWVQHKKTVIK